MEKLAKLEAERGNLRYLPEGKVSQIFCCDIEVFEEDISMGKMDGNAPFLRFSSICK